MKKILTLALVFMMVISLFVSCNDGEEGLFQMAANSVRKESFKILNIVNKESENVYIVATDNGIALTKTRMVKSNSLQAWKIKCLSHSIQ